MVVLKTKAFVVNEAGHEKIAYGDRFQDWQVCGIPDRVAVCRKLGALHERKQCMAGFAA